MTLSAVIVLSYKFFGYLLEQFAPKTPIFKSNEFIVFVYVWKTLSVSCTTYFLGKEKKEEVWNSPKTPNDNNGKK